LSRVAHNGETVAVGSAGPPTIVYFYPKDDTPGCTKEACAFRDAWDRYAQAGVRVIGVSTDSNESHREFAEKHDLRFALIADEDRQWAQAFGVPTRAGMAKRVSFLIDRKGTVVKVYPDVDPAVHAEQVLRDASGL
jgi:peroxiredoxin Q/BCP